MTDWLEKRLTPKKQDVPRWRELAEALQLIWGEFFDPKLQRLLDMRSTYTIQEEDLAARIRELGDYFNWDIPEFSSRAIDLGWRRLELDFKEHEFIMLSALRRHFGNLEATWLPIYAPKDKTYGEGFIISDKVSVVDDGFATEDSLPILVANKDKNEAPEGYFLTSRGVIGVDKVSLLARGLKKSDFTERAEPLARRTKPLHIVFDSFLWYAKFILKFCVSASWTQDVESGTLELLFAPPGTRFDYVPADAQALDIFQAFSIERDSQRPLSLPFFSGSMEEMGLDRDLPENPFEEDAVPCDLTARKAFRNHFSEASRRAELDCTPQVSFETLCTREAKSLGFGAEAASTGTQERSADLPAFGDDIPMPLDHSICFDDIRADFCPTDCPYGGFVYV